MPSPPQLLFPGKVVLISTRIQEGLPIVCTPYMRVILESILARAQTLYKVKICHYIFMGNHLHIIAIIEDPSDMTNFMDRVKTESSHAINRLLGRRQRTVWCKGFHAPAILTLEDAVEKIAYIYLNPQKANLVETIEDYPGLSSWALFTSKKHTFKAKLIRRPQIKKLNSFNISLENQQKLAEQLTRESKICHEFELSPDAWMKAFKITTAEEIDEINKQIILRVREYEENYKKQRATHNKSILGKRSLSLQPINKAYTPKKFGKKMYCVCNDIKLRIEYIRYVKELISLGKEVYHKWKSGDLSVQYPIGLFPPRQPRLANLIFDDFQII